MSVRKLAVSATLLSAFAFPDVGEATTAEFTVQPSCAAQSFLVPAAVTSIFVEAFGAQGGPGDAGVGPGGGGNAAGGLGGKATATLAVTPLETLQINVGGRGGSATTVDVSGTNRCNGGASAGTGLPGGGDGGGASDVSRAGTRLVIAGGGGGGGGGGSVEFPGGGGGAGGGSPGGNGSPGAGNAFGGNVGAGGIGATQADGGAGGGLGGSVGTSGAGGPGGSSATGGAGGGGGGGGLFGGGGGGAAFGFGAGGGGGGSGLVPAGGTLTQGVQVGNGLVRITYSVVAATFRSLTAVRVPTGVSVRWRTASEVDVLGFQVYRQVGATRVRVSRKLVPARRRGGGSYAYLDRAAPSGRPVRYWIRVVNLDGSRRWYGPARVARAATA